MGLPAVGWMSGKGRLAGSRLARNELARECARDDRRRLETSGRWSPLYPRSSRQRKSLLGYARAPDLASVYQCSQCIQLVQIREVRDASPFSQNL